MQTQTQTQQPQTQQPLDILQQFDVLLKNHSIVVTDRENLAMLFEKIVDLCTQMPKAKLKAALNAATTPAAAAAAANTPESLSPIVQSSSSHSFGQFVEALEVEAPEVEVEAPKTVVKAAKAPKTVKAPKEPKTVKAPKEPKTAVKAPKEPKAPKAVNAKEVEVAV